jgi:hypothetical protein
MEIERELGGVEFLRIAIDAITQQDLDIFQCSGSNTIGLKKHMDPLYDIKCAEWGGIPPSSQLDMYFNRWKDEGQNNQNIDIITQEKVVKQPMIFELDPMDTVEDLDEYADALVPEERLERYDQNGNPLEANFNLRLENAEEALIHQHSTHIDPAKQMNFDEILLNGPAGGNQATSNLENKFSDVKLKSHLIEHSVIPKENIAEKPAGNLL